jgi:hypothetical protein
VLGLLALGLGDLAFLLTGDYMSFLLAAGLLGIGDFFVGSQTALLASTATPSGRTQVLAGFRLATDAGALVGPIALAALMDMLGPHTAMVGAAGVLVVAAVISQLAIAVNRAPSRSAMLSSGHAD